jgi:hypothetical protein
MQTKINQGVNGDARDSNRCPETSGAAETIRRAQILTRPFEYDDGEPNGER